MNWTLIYAPSFKSADLRQDSFALALGGSATSSNVGVQTVA